MSLFWPFGTLRLIANDSLLVTVEDWSEVRSHSRAKRRRARGHRQRISFVQVADPTLYRVGDTIFAHSATIDALGRELVHQVPIRL